MHCYVGVTGFTEAAQVTRAIRVVPKDPITKFMVGVLASAKSLRNIPLRTQWQSRYPKTEHIREIFPDDPRAFNLVHFAPGRKHRKELPQDLIAISDEVGSRLQGFQINATWPREHDLAIYREKCGYLRQTVVLQIGREAMEHLEDYPRAIADRVNRYGGLIDGVLIDASGGNGVLFDPAFTRALISQIRSLQPELGIGIAGGISHRTLDQVPLLLEEFPNLSFDAESGLRTADGELDGVAVDLYLRRSYAMLARVPHKVKASAHVLS